MPEEREYEHPPTIQCTLVEGDIPAAIARDAEVTAAIAAHAGDPDAHHTPGGVVFDGSLVYNANAPVAWTDLDLSAYVGENQAVVLLKVVNMSTTPEILRFRKDGDIYQTAATDRGASIVKLSFHFGWKEAAYVILVTSTSGIIEWISDQAVSTRIYLEAYWK